MKTKSPAVIVVSLMILAFALGFVFGTTQPQTRKQTPVIAAVDDQQVALIDREAVLVMEAVHRTESFEQTAAPTIVRRDVKSKVPVVGKETTRPPILSAPNLYIDHNAAGARARSFPYRL